MTSYYRFPFALDAGNCELVERTCQRRILGGTGRVVKESTESEGQGVGNSSVCFIALHLVFVGSRIRRKSFVEICVVVVDFLCSDF